jgi:hypothetical protein
MRSAYYLELDRKARQYCCSFVCSQQSPIWKAIWKLKVPRVIHLFLWRACNNILPTKENLLRRKIVSDPICPLCGREVETSGHVLWGCDAARSVWSESLRAIQKCAVEANEFNSIFSYLSDRLSQEDLELAAIITQRIWLRRNQWVFENTFMPPKCLLIGACDSLQKFREVNSPCSSSISQNFSSQFFWKPPSADSVKVN